MAEIYRHELKYLISENEIPLIQQRLRPFMRFDSHAPEGIYRISSVYFDDMDESGYYAVDDGLDLKRKYRIRIYNGSDEVIRLERKKKRDSRAHKKTCLLTREEADRLIRGEYLRDLSGKDELLKEFTAETMMKRLRPVIIVEYDRIPYVYDAGNVRITLDLNIRSSTDIGRFFTGTDFRRAVLPKGMQLLEVKYDGILPDHIRDLFSDLSLQQISFSKYYLCRKYNVRGGSLL